MRTQEFDIFVNGHSLARNEDALERLADRLKVKPLLEFFSADENSMALLLEQGAGDPEWASHLPRPQWFSPADGLISVCALIGFLLKNQAALGSETAQVLSELARIRVCLAQNRPARLSLASGRKLAVKSQPLAVSY